MKPNERGALALAYAFLDGAWTEEGLIVRGQLIVGHSRPEFRKLVRRVLRAYKRPPWDRPREFAAWLVIHDVADEQGSRVIPMRRLTRWLPYQPAMAEMPWHVPAIPTLGELGHFFGLSSTELDWFADVRSWERRVADERLRHYRYRWVRKKDGNLRLIESPKERLREIQRHLLHAVLDRIPAHDSAHGFVRSRSAITFAANHTNADVVVRLDIANFFTSISAGRVYGLFRTAGYPESVAHMLTGLTTNSIPIAIWREAPQRTRDDYLVGKQLGAPHLPQGAPTSPALANLCSHRLDRRLSGLASSFGARYSRYADDLAISGSLSGPSIARVVSLASDIAQDEGFTVRPAKTLVMGKSHRQRLAGIVVNSKPNVERAAYDRLRATLKNASLRGLAAENRKGEAHFSERLAGHVSWAISLNPGRRRKLVDLLTAAVRRDERG